MTIGTSPVGPDVVGTPDPARLRDADNTRQLLLHAARRRFARDGYSATTVRDIAMDAGVNVALINRYFLSKEGLFENCLENAAHELGTPVDGQLTQEQLLHLMVSRIADATSGEQALQLMLLLRSSGDAGADQVRRNILEAFARRMATAAGWRDGELDSDILLLRAQIAVSAALGLVLMRSSTGIEPLTSAADSDLYGPVGDLITGLLKLPGDPGDPGNPGA